MTAGPPWPLILRLRWLVLAAFIGLSAVLAPRAAQVERDDDVLAFLPPDDPEVTGFFQVARRFGMLDVALVGLDGGAAGMLGPDRVRTVRALTERLRAVEGVRMVLSFVDLPHPVVTPGGLEVAALVPEGMDDPEAIRRRVLGSRDAVGNLVSADGRAAALLVFLRHEADGRARAALRRTATAGIRAAVAALWDGPAYFGGAPFVENEASEASQADLAALSPVVIGVLALATALLLRSVAAALVNLLLSGLAIVWVLGLHAVFDEPLTIVSNTLPVLMVALGGAFGVHLLSGVLRRDGPPMARAAGALRELFVPVLLSGLTTAVAFFALAALPQVPVRRFGVVAGLGMLLLLVFALVVLPALVAVLPRRVLPHRDPSARFARVRLPRWVLVVVGLGTAASWSGLTADPDTLHVFAPDSEPRRSAAFFDAHFEGSTFVQVGIEADLADPAVLQAIRDLRSDLAALRSEGVADVRSLIEPVATLNAALGGRRGIPETPARARRVLSMLADHPAMAQLMTPDARAALLHVKLAPAQGPARQAVLDRISARVERLGRGGTLAVLDARAEKVAAARRARVAALVGRVLGRPLSEAERAALARPVPPDPALLAEARRLRDQALDSEDSPVEGVPRAEIETIDPASLLDRSVAQTEAILRRHLPTLVATDPEGVRFAAEHLHAWLVDAKARWEVAARCRSLGIEPYGRTGPAPGGDEGDAPPLSPACERVSGLLAELSDPTWAVTEVPEGARVVRAVPLRAARTGEPFLGRAFAESVTTNVRTSTLLSAGALAAVLALFGFLRALVPALWTLALVGGVLALLGHPVSIGTSMVASIALGAGVDFAIHLLFWSRRHRRGGREAVAALGGVVAASGVTLGLSFSVLGWASMPPVAQFGIGIAVALVGAAAGALLWVPHLRPGRADGGRQA